MSPMSGDAIGGISLDEMSFLVRANERDIRRLENEQANFVTTQVLDLKMTAFTADLIGRIDAATRAVTAVQASVDRLVEDREVSRDRMLRGFALPVISGLLVSILGALIVLGMSR